MPLAIFCGCTAWFVSDLVGNSEDRFSQNEAHFTSIFQLVPMLQSLMYPNVVKVVAANDDTDEGNKVE